MVAQTRFSRARVVRDDPLLTLYLDGVPSSALDVADPQYLEFEYMQHMRLLVDAVMPPPAPIRALHLGGAGCALPRALAHTHPNSRQLAVEVDDLLAGVVREWFDLPRSPELRIRAAEGREVLDRQAELVSGGAHGWDTILRDAFASAVVPVQLTTVESVQAAARSLTPTGVYIMNSTGDVKEDIAAALTAFKHVLLIADPAVLGGKRRGNVVIGCAQVPWPASIERDVRKLSLPATVMRDVASWVSGTAPREDPPQEEG